MHHQMEPDYLEDLDNFKTCLKSYDKSGEKSWWKIPHEPGYYWNKEKENIPIQKKR